MSIIRRLILSLALLCLACGIWFGLIQLATGALLDSLHRDPLSVSLNADLVRLLPGSRRVAIPALLKALENKVAVVRWHACEALAFFDPQYDEVGPALIALLKHDDHHFRWNAAFLLGELGQPAEPATEALLSAMKDEHAGDVLLGGVSRSSTRHYDVVKDQSVRSAAAEALGKIGSSSEPVVAALHEGLADANPFVRLDSAAALWKINGNTTDIMPVLIAILDSPASERKLSLRPAAAELLGEMGANARQAVPALTRALSFRGGDAREEAATALGKIVRTRALRDLRSRQGAGGG